MIVEKKKLYTVKEVADIFQISVERIRRIKLNFDVSPDNINRMICGTDYIIKNYHEHFITYQGLVKIYKRLKISKISKINKICQNY